MRESSQMTIGEWATWKAGQYLDELTDEHVEQIAHDEGAAALRSYLESWIACGDPERDALSLLVTQVFNYADWDQLTQDYAARYTPPDEEDAEDPPIATLEQAYEYFCTLHYNNPVKWDRYALKSWMYDGGYNLPYQGWEVRMAFSAEQQAQ